MAIRGVDYSGGRPGGAALNSAGFSFACRYVYDDGGGTKLLSRSEADDLKSNGIAIVSNFESTADRATDGYDAGVADAHTAVSNTVAAGGPPDSVIYFSVDFDAQSSVYASIFAYLDGAASVIGAQQVGIYAGYYVVKAALDNGKAAWSWQTQAWSAQNVDPRINIYQLNDASPVTIGGVECDVNEARTSNFGQWGAETGGGFDANGINQFKAAFMGPIGSDVKDIREQLCGAGSRDQGQFTGWPQLGGRSVVDAVAAIGASLGISGFYDPHP